MEAAEGSSAKVNNSRNIALLMQEKGVREGEIHWISYDKCCRKWRL
jgi:hypothetical protein